MILTVRPRALRELAEIQDWYEEREPGLGSRWLEDVARALEQIHTAPHSAPVHRLPVRRLRLRHFPFQLFYPCKAEEITVVSVLHIRRHPGHRPIG